MFPSGPVLYGVTPESLAGDRLFRAVEAVLNGGTQLIQYRSKFKPSAQRELEARTLVTLCTRHSAALIINDDAELAHRVNAQGVHLGANDGTIADARRLLGPKALIGASCYGDLGRARAASAAGASYLAFGAMFASTTKPEAPLAKMTVLLEARRLGLPVCAIGGVAVSNAALLIRSGADWLAVVSDLFLVHDPETQARCFLQAIRDASAAS